MQQLKKDSSFENFKIALTSTLTLALLDFSLAFKLEIDAFVFKIDIVLR